MAGIPPFVVLIISDLVICNILGLKFVIHCDSKWKIRKSA